MWLAHRILGNSVFTPSYHAPWREICFTHMYLHIDTYIWMQIHTGRYSYTHTHTHTHTHICTHTPVRDLLHMTHSDISCSFKLSSLEFSDAGVIHQHNLTAILDGDSQRLMKGTHSLYLQTRFPLLLTFAFPQCRWIGGIRSPLAPEGNM